jgi:hypothetical protein
MSQICFARHIRDTPGGRPHLVDRAAHTARSLALDFTGRAGFEYHSWGIHLTHWSRHQCWVQRWAFPITCRAFVMK